jgi:hypothetical protein
MTESSTSFQFRQQVEPPKPVPAATAIEVEPLWVIPLDSEVKGSIILSVEQNIKSVLEALAKKEDIGMGCSISAEEYEHLPNSITGCLVYYLIKGLKEDFNIEFDPNPISTKQRGGDINRRKAEGKKRLLTKSQKNELLDRTKMSFYENQIYSGAITLDAAMDLIKAAFQEKKQFEGLGLVLPEKKTEAPYYESEGKRKRKNTIVS